MSFEPVVFDARLDVVPTNPGVYLMKDASGSVIYVGKAKNLRNRLRSYFTKNPSGNEKVLAMISHIADFEFMIVSSELEALLLEANLIKRHMPQYNILLRDDKGYPYVCITMNEEYPRIFRSFRIGKDKEQGARYFGPFLAGDLYRALATLREIFPTKTCRRVLPRDIGKERPCLNYYIGRCVAPCKGDVPASVYRDVMEDICRFFEGKYDGIQKDIETQMLGAAEAEDYEKAAIYRDRLLSLQKIMEAQMVTLSVEKDLDVIALAKDAGEFCVRKLEVRGGRITGSLTFFLPDKKEEDGDILAAFIEQHYQDVSFMPKEVLLPSEPTEGEDLRLLLQHWFGYKPNLRVPQRGDGYKLLQLAERNAKEALLRRVLRVGDSENALSSALLDLAERLGLAESPGRIEAFDISNLGSDDKAGGMVVFKNGRPDKASYRLFKIKNKEGQDDYGAMTEVLERRFSRKEDSGFGLLPEVLLMDGGLQHVRVAEAVLKKLSLDKKIYVAGMVKDKRHRTRGLTLPSGETLELAERAATNAEDLLLLRLITAIQNEVHRFALSYQRKLSKKRHLSFRLETIEGIGPAKRKALLAHFTTIGRIASAEVAELLEVPRISEENAKAIYNHFHQNDRTEQTLAKEE